MLTFEELAAFRADLRAFAHAHRESVEQFYEPTHGWFRVDLNTTGGGSSDKSVRHLTSTITCLESLHDAARGPDGKAAAVADVAKMVAAFADKALNHPADWSSDDGAYVYCRVRALGPLLRLLRTPDVMAPQDAGKLVEQHKQTIDHLLAFAWSSRSTGPIYGVREGATRINPGESDEKYSAAIAELGQGSEDRKYPPNSFLTYWALVALREAGGFGLVGDLGSCEGPAVQWLDTALSHQIAYYLEGSPHADPQQLAWSISALVKFTPEDRLAAKGTPEYVRLRAGLNAFFAQQHDDGNWDLGKPLFHYPSVGNAYCYVFETVAELLSLAASGHTNAAILREELKAHAGGLRRLFDYAQAQLQRKNNDKAVGWSSGHHLHRSHPESWATASVFRFVHMARMLVGAWASESAQGLLRAATPKETVEDLASRGDTWNTGHDSAGRVLATTFLNPAQAREQRLTQAAHPDYAKHAFTDPDVPIVSGAPDEPFKGSRSAMLFGPPGTGKTTLIRAVAGAMRWPFVEITPAHFLDEGVDLVSKRADEIFNQVMELDRCVVLLDEIDELIQRRSEEADSLERFFTTSMLPRLAKLWDAGKVLFFANTNDVGQVDPAIRRSQRFDAAMLVLPPGYDAKRALLGSDGEKLWPYPEERSTADLVGGASEEDCGLGWFALARYDQMNRLGRDLRAELALIEGVGEADGNQFATLSAVKGVLQTYAHELEQLDWLAQAESGWGEGQSDPEDPSSTSPHRLVAELLKAQRDDHKADMVLAACPGAADAVRSHGAETAVQGDYIVVPTEKREKYSSWLQEMGLHADHAGRLAFLQRREAPVP